MQIDTINSHSDAEKQRHLENAMSFDSEIQAVYASSFNDEVLLNEISFRISNMRSTLFRILSAMEATDDRLD